MNDMTSETRKLRGLFDRQAMLKRQIAHVDAQIAAVGRRYAEKAGYRATLRPETLKSMVSA